MQRKGGREGVKKISRDTYRACVRLVRACVRLGKKQKEAKHAKRKTGVLHTGAVQNVSQHLTWGQGKHLYVYSFFFLSFFLSFFSFSFLSAADGARARCGLAGRGCGLHLCRMCTRRV